VTALSAGAATVVGQVRTTNEDSHLVLPDLVVVADGMGGHRGGEVASATTVRVVGEQSGGGTLEDLVAAVQRANRQVHDDAARDPSLRGMGTTVCAVGLVQHDDVAELAVLNVGDSRVYLLANGRLEQLTEDHSLVETLVREGRLSPEDAEVHPQRNVLTRALGVEAAVAVDAWLLRPADGDRLLLCSDGLFNEVAEDRIAELLAEPDAPEIVARRLCAEADAAGGRDNITVVVLDVSDTGAAPSPLDERYRRFSTPAVDLWEESDGPKTDTVLAVIATGSPQPEEAAVVDDADDGTEVAAPTDAVAPAGDTTAASDERASRSGRWRSIAFVAALAAVIVLALGAITVVGRAGYFLGTEGDRVVVYSGQKWGVLWFAPTVVKRTDITLDDLQEAGQLKVRSQQGGYANAAAAEAFLQRNTTTTTTSTTTTTTTTTTTAVPPPAPPPADAVPVPLPPPVPAPAPVPTPLPAP
jgi:protein phosphatase